MGKSYKNFWSLNTDEAVVTGILRAVTVKDIEVFIPINAQMKDIDLILMNMKNRKTVTIQVKGSRAYEPRKSEVEKFGDGSAGWFSFKKEVIHKSTADYFIFLVYVLEQIDDKGRRTIVPHTITIPIKDLKELCNKNKISDKDQYNFYLWVNPKTKESFDFRDKKYFLNQYLGKKGFELLNRKLD